jgi:hypothetical protein
MKVGEEVALCQAHLLQIGEAKTELEARCPASTILAGITTITLAGFS